MSADLHTKIQSIATHAAVEAAAASFYDYASEEAWSYHGDRWFHAASTIKVAVLAGLFGAVEQGRFKPGDRLHVRNRFISVAGGKAYAVAAARDPNNDVHMVVGKQMRLHVLAEHMIATSSNLATNLLLDLIGAKHAQRALDDLGISGIDLRRGVEDDDAYQAGINNRVTADGLVALFRLIEDRGAFSDATAEAMLEILHKQQFKSGIPAGIPESVRSEAQFAHKTGDISTVTHDAGLVYLPGRKPYAVAILTEWDPDASNRRETVAAISEAIFEHLADAGA